MTSQLPFFVYGTLRRGGSNHRVAAPFLASASPALLRGHVLYVSGLPYMGVSDDPGSTVTGDLFQIADGMYETARAALDRLEGYRPPDHEMYRRREVTVQYRPSEDGDWAETRAWAYLAGDMFSCEPQYVVPSGDFADAGRLRGELTWS